MSVATMNMPIASLAAVPPAKRPPYRPKKLRKPMGPYRTVGTAFVKGKDRQVDVTFHPGFLEVRVAGLLDSFRLTYQQVYDKGCANGAGFDPAARTGRLTRGTVS